MRFPQSEAPRWDTVRDGDPLPDLPPLGRVVVAVVLAIAALAVGVTVYSWSLTRDDVAGAPLLQTPMVSEAV